LLNNYSIIIILTKNNTKKCKNKFLERDKQKITNHQKVTKPYYNLPILSKLHIKVNFTI